MDVLSYLRDRYAPSRLNLSRDGLQQLEFAVRRLYADQSGMVQVSDLSEVLVVSHLKSLLAAGLSPSTVNTRRGALLTIWKHAYRKGFNENDPQRADIDRAMEPTRRPVAWSIEHLKVMLQQAERIKRRGRCNFGPREWRALILLLYYTGLRIKAALQLRTCDLCGDILTVPHSIQKDKEELRFRLPEHLVHLLRSLPRPEAERHGRKIANYLIPWPWALHDSQAKLTHHILKPSGLPTDRRHKFHAIRRTVATIIAHRKGKEAARDVLGHSCLSVTEKYLADPSTVDANLPPNLSPVDVLPQI